LKIFIKYLIFCLGLGLCSYPIISNLLEGHRQQAVITSYQQVLESTDDVALMKMKENAILYNDMLYQSKGYIINDERCKYLSREYYNTLMNIDLNGVMGYIEIPKINVYLPIYHGTDEDVLSIGIGHLYGSSLPVGGNNTRSVLTGHRGLPNSKLFTRLDELVQGDLFYIYSLDEVKAYSVYDIEVIEPTQIEKLETKSDKDLVTLVTCTPYGINTHRLLVTGERVPFHLQEYESIDSVSISIRELFFMCVPFLFCGYGILKIGMFVWKKRR